MPIPASRPSDLVPDDAAPPAPALTACLLGRGNVRIGTETLRLPYAKAQALLVLLLLEPSGQPREQLMHLLWPDHEPATARSNLRHALHLLRRLLGPARLRTARELVVLELQPGDEVDVRTLCRRDDDALLASLDDYHGELMAGWRLPDAPTFMAWLDRQRLVVHADVVAALQRLQTRIGPSAEPLLRLAVARVQVRIDPWHDAPHLSLMQALADAGRAAEALAHWELVREHFRRDLDAAPSAALLQLAQRLQQGSRCPEAAAAPAPDPGAHRFHSLADAPPDSSPDRVPDGEPDAGPGVGASMVTDAGALMHFECRALDPRDAQAAAVIDDVQTAVTAAALAVGARLQRAGGGSLLMRFDGARPARLGPCERALRMAQDAQRVWRTHPGASRVALRIGLHRGPLLPAREDRLDPLGQVAGVAVAVAASGLAGDILASPAFTQRLPAHDWVLLPRRAGLYGEATLPVLRLAAVDPAQGRVEPVLLGRNPQMAALLLAWRRARRGQPRVLALLGPPGSGKSRLVRWALQGLPGCLHPWVIDCLPARREAPGAPLATWLAALCGVPLLGDDAQRLPVFEAGLRRLAPELPAPAVDALACLVGLRAGHPEWTPTQRRKDLLDAFVALLEARLRQGPLLLVLEDLHWADFTTLQAAEAAAQRLADAGSGAPLLILATARPAGESGGVADSPLPGWPTLHLPPLDVGMSRALARRVLQQQGQLTLAPDAVAAIVDRADGNPLFIEALAMAAAVAGRDGDGGLMALAGHAPSSLDDSLMGSLAAEPAARQLARAASVLGEAFSLALLRALCADMGDDAWHAAWRQLLRHGLVHRDGEPGQGRFHHALIRDAAYASLGSEQRRLLHARAVQAALAERPELARTEPLWLARHAEQGALLETAVDGFEQAALQALALAAFSEAAAHFGRALALVERLPLSAGHRERALRLALGRAQATVPLAGYGAEDTHRHFRAVLDLGGPDLGVEPGHDAVFQAHYGLWLGGSSRGGYRQALGYVQRVQRHANASAEPIHQLQAAYAWGNTRLWLGELEPARAHLEQAIALHGQLPAGALFPSYTEDTGVIARALLAWVLWLQGDAASAEQREAEALALAEQLDHVYSLAFALACRARLGVMRGDVAAVARALERLLDLARRHDLALWQAVGGVEYGWLLTVQGDASGLDVAARAVELAAPALPALEVTMLSMQADALFRSGRLGHCAAVVAHALDRCEHWDDRYMQPELLRLAALCEPASPAAARLLERGCAQALGQGAVAWVQRIAG